MQLQENDPKNVFGMFLKHEIPPLTIELTDRFQIMFSNI